MKMDNPILTINGAQLLKSYYSIYIIKLVNEKENVELFYVGKTGDNNHISARPVFRRMAGHLLDYASSDQNQLYKGVVKHLKIDLADLKDKNKQPALRDQVEEFLVNSEIEVYSYKLEDFNYTIDEEKHKIFVKEKLNVFEKQVISFFRSKNISLINEKEKTVDFEKTEFPELIQQVVKDFNLK